MLSNFTLIRVEITLELVIYLKIRDKRNLKLNHCHAFNQIRGKT